MVLQSRRVTDAKKTVDDYIQYWKDLVCKVEEGFPHTHLPKLATDVLDEIKSILNGEVQSPISTQKHRNLVQQALQGNINSDPSKTHVVAIKELLQAAGSINTEVTLALVRLYNMIEREWCVLEHCINLRCWFDKLDNDYVKRLFVSYNMLSNLQELTNSMEGASNTREKTDIALGEWLKQYKARMVLDRLGDHGLLDAINQLAQESEPTNKKVVEVIKGSIDSWSVELSTLMEIAKDLGAPEEELAQYAQTANRAATEEIFMDVNLSDDSGSRRASAHSGRDSVLNQVRDGMNRMGATVSQSFQGKSPRGLGAKHKEEVRGLTKESIRLRQEINQAMSRVCTALASSKSQLIEAMRIQSDDVANLETIRKQHIANIRSTYQDGIGSRETHADEFCRKLPDIWQSRATEETRAHLNMERKSVFKVLTEHIAPKMVRDYTCHAYDPDSHISKQSIDKSLQDEKNASRWRQELQTLNVTTYKNLRYASRMTNFALIASVLYLIGNLALAFFVPGKLLAGLLLNTEVAKACALAILLLDAILVIGAMYFYQKTRSAKIQFLKDKGVSIDRYPWMGLYRGLRNLGRWIWTRPAAIGGTCKSISSSLLTRSRAQRSRTTRRFEPILNRSNNQVLNRDHPSPGY